jgi:hypothetical protein
MLKLRNLAPLLALLLPALGHAHPFLDVQPFPPATVASGASYTLELDVFPGDTPIESVQLDFELSSPGVFGTPAAVMGDGFTFVYDGVADPLHFSIVGDFTGAPLEEFGIFHVGDITMSAGVEDSLIMLDSSVIVALEGEAPQEFPREQFSNLRFTNVVVHVVPEPGAAASLGCGLLALVALSRSRRAAAR